MTKFPYRLNRLGFWLYSLYALMAGTGGTWLCLLVIDFLFISVEMYAFFIYTIMALWLYLAALRCVDTGINGGWILLFSVPGLNILILLWTLFAPSDCLRRTPKPAPYSSHKAWNCLENPKLLESHS